MRIPVALLAMIGVLAPGCFTYSAPAPPPTSMTAWSPTGSFSFSSGGNCAGQISLVGGLATVTDQCFTSSYNVVVCSDNTMANLVRCTPAIGSLTLSGTGSDSISYARLK
ncbi:MAG TPA: hypothetical protein VKV03_10030 [Candidatus Binataceae bacterium]|nr:hypothetical protein [Candidatus Binataceae bacterium]